MKILFIKKYMHQMGGSEYQMNFLINYLNNLFYYLNNLNLLSNYLNNKINVIWWSYKINFKLFPELKKNNRIYYNYKSKFYNVKYYWIIDLLITLINTKPDIIYTRDSRRVWIYLLLSKIFNNKLVWSINYQINSTPFTIKQLIQMSYYHYNQLKKFAPWLIFAYFNNKLLNNINLITQNNEYYNYLKNKNLKYRFIYNGQEVPPINLNRKVEPPVIICIGNLGRRRRPEIFLKLVKDLSDKQVDREP